MTRSMHWRGVAPLAVFAAALTARAFTATGIGFPIPQNAAYYVSAAQNLATGRGLVVDMLWTYGMPPLTLPHPAFDLWQPLASLIMAPLMVIVGPSLAAAQASSVAVGSLAAPLAWMIGRRAARQLGLPPPRVEVVALTAGLLVAFAPLLVVQAAEPDSSAPFIVLALLACALVPDAIAERAPTRRARVLLGLALGLAYLARQEAIYVAVAYVLLAVIEGRRHDDRVMAQLGRTVPALGMALLVVAPWLIRQEFTWQVSPFALTLENAWLVRQTDIFAWTERPTLGTHLALGPGGLASLRIEALTWDLGFVLATAFPAALLGLGVLIARPSVARLPALRPLAVAGALTFAVDVVVFPVAGQAGLWAHGAGPVIALLAIIAAIGLDGALARMGALRGWRPVVHPLAPVALLPPLIAVSLSVPLAGLAGALEHQRAALTMAQYHALAVATSRWDTPSGPIVTDHPMWLSVGLAREALALPREGPLAVVTLAAHFDAAALVVRDVDPEMARLLAGLLAYRNPDGSACFRELPAPPPFRALGHLCATARQSRVGSEEAGNRPVYWPVRPIEPPV
jgi:hypothetical protein